MGDDGLWASLAHLWDNLCEGTILDGNEQHIHLGREGGYVGDRLGVELFRQCAGSGIRATIDLHHLVACAAERRA